MKKYTCDARKNEWKSVFESEDLLDCIIYAKEHGYIPGISCRFSYFETTTGAILGSISDLPRVLLYTKEELEKIMKVFNLCDCSISKKYASCHWYHETEWECDFYLKIA